MKSVFILITILIATGTTVLGQKSEPNKEQIQSIQKVVNAFKKKDKSKIADLIYYPLRREYPLKDIKGKNDLIRHFDDIFDKKIIDSIAGSKINDWSTVGWRGITLDNGIIWIDDDGMIMAVNYQSTKEKQLLADAIRADKNQLPKSLQDFDKPLYLILTKDYKIRIDEESDGVYRYAAWKIKDQTKDPDIVMENGVLAFQGSGGNHTITFKNSDYTYIVSINEVGTADNPDAVLEVSNQGKSVLTEDGKVMRN